jgi:hypothetical protein
VRTSIVVRKELFLYGQRTNVFDKKAIIKRFCRTENNFQIEKIRNYYGLNFKNGDNYIYYTCFELNSFSVEEREKFTTFILPKGKYVSYYLNNWFIKNEKTANIFNHIIFERDGNNMPVVLEYHRTGNDLQLLIPLDFSKQAS